MWNMFKGAISGHIQFLATGSSLKIMKNAFYFTLKYFFVLKIFKFLSLLFVVEKLILDPFLKNQNWAYLGINNSRFTQFVFIVCQVQGYQNMLKLSCRSLLLPHIKLF